MFDANENKSIEEAFQFQICLSKICKKRKNCNTWCRVGFFSATEQPQVHCIWFPPFLLGDVYMLLECRLFYSAGLFKEQHETFPSVSQKRKHLPTDSGIFSTFIFRIAVIFSLTFLIWLPWTGGRSFPARVKGQATQPFIPAKCCGWPASMAR